ncbi:MAG: peptidoglycan hydrolase RipC [Mycobacterium sp.]|nr:peptidoglycan hydrolase RipC [Mycobacterium sp.]
MLDRTSLSKSAAHKWFAGAVAGAMALASLLSTPAVADPAQDAVTKISELSRQAEQLTEQMHAAEIDLDTKVQAQTAAEQSHANDLAALDAARLQLSSYQGSVNTLAASVYMGGRTDGLNAILTAASPQGLIDKMAVQRVMGIEMSAQMQSFRNLSAEAVQIEAASAKSAADAATAADEAAAVRADLQGKQSQLQVQITAVKSRYALLTALQRATLAGPAALPPAILAAPAPEAAPESGPSSEILAMAAALPSPGAGGGGGSAAVQAALTRLGTPYVWGAAGPGEFDCSGLIMWAYQQAGIFLPHSSYALAAGGQPVSLDQMQPGDVITYYSDASHVGMYVGDGMMVHASTFGIPVAVVPVNNAPIYNVRRY